VINVLSSVADELAVVRGRLIGLWRTGSR